MKAARIAEMLGQDVRYGLRQARQSPGLAAVIVLSLALGIGANSALFSVVNTVALKTATVSDPEHLLVFGWFSEKSLPDEIQRTQSGRGARDSADRQLGLSFPYPSFNYIRDHARSFSSVTGFVPLGMFNKPSAVVRGEPMFVDGEMVTANYFGTVGVRAARGRLISKDDQDPAAPRVGVISDSFWNRMFGRAVSAIGETITLNGVPVTIVGVAQRGFEGLEPGRSPDLWIPITLQQTITPWGVRPSGPPEMVYAQPDYWWLQVVGRLKPGVTEQQAQAEVSRLLRDSFAGAIDSSMAASVPGVGFLPGASGLNRLKRRFSKPLYILAAVVAAVLLVACANVATLLLARATTRRKEMSVRLAMGAPRSRLFVQLLTEHAMYAAAGATLALAVAVSGGRILLALLSAGNDPLPVTVGLDLRVLGFTAAISIVTTVLFGLAPALRATRVEVASDLKTGVGGSARDIRLGRLRIGRLFVVGQIAMTLPLLIGAGLFLRTLSNLEGERLGFDKEHLLLFTVDASKAGYKDAALVNVYRDLREEIEGLPGVRATTMSRLSLISGWVNNGPIVVEGGGTAFAHWNPVGPRFAETMGMKLLLGRNLDERDVATSPHVAVANETAARKFFGGASPIGRTFWFGRQRGDDPISIVGVLQDAKFDSVRKAAPPTLFVPYTQTKAPLSSMKFEVRTAGDPMAIAGQVARIARRVVPGVPLGEVRTQAAQIDESLASEYMFAKLFTFFGLTALLLACLGLHGTMAYTLRRRTREIGIRIAIGAGRPALLRMALGETLVMALSGIAVGGLLAAAGSRFIRSLLFGVDALNPSIIAAGTGLMLLVAIVAGYVPARRASRLDPIRALRED